MRKSLIFTRNADNSIMTPERVKELAPAVFADSKADHLTDRYKQFRTADLLPIMADHGYFPVQAAQVRSKAAQHGHHLVSFAKEGDVGQELRPEVIVYNSHNGQGALRLFAGVYRFICSNGIVAGNGFDARIYHSHRQLNGFEDMLRNIVDGLPTMMERMEEMKQQRLDFDTIVDIADKACALRWDKYQAGETKTGSYYTDTTIGGVLDVKREQDEGIDAFSVFNRIQENVLRGHAMIQSFTAAAPFGAMRKARPVAAVKEHVRINREIFDLFETV